MSEQQEQYVSVLIVLKDGRIIEGHIRLPIEDLEHLHMVIDKKYGFSQTETLSVADVLVEPSWSEWLSYS